MLLARTALLPVRWQISSPSCGVMRSVGAAAHELESGFDFATREDVEKWRLFEARSERLFERVVKHWVAGLVGEIGEDDGVLLV